jgi:hypothetical protein
MNRFIEFDIYNGITQLKCAIINILNALDSQEIAEYDFGEYISYNLIRNCMEEDDWKLNYVWISPSGLSFIFKTIENSLILCKDE